VPYLNPAAHGLANHIIHCGYLRSVTGDRIRSWKNDQLLPNVLYLKQYQVVDSYFGGILFEAERGASGEMLSAKAIGFGSNPTAVAWQQAIEELFQKDQNLAITLQISKQRPNHKTLDIWIALPYPVETKQDFGTIHGRTLNFRVNPTDREIALKWWIDAVVAAWNQVSQSISGHHARLCGFAWTKSSLGSNDETLIQAISEYIHKGNLKCMWCQNYGTAKAWEGYNLGFDLVFTRPTYTNIDPRGTAWLNYAAKFSNVYNLGLIVWGDPRISSNQLSSILDFGRKTFMKAAFQIYELGDDAVYELYKKADPMYDALYSFINGTLTSVPRSI
jgi:hypothetical protein